MIYQWPLWAVLAVSGACSLSGYLWGAARRRRTLQAARAAGRADALLERMEHDALMLADGYVLRLGRGARVYWHHRDDLAPWDRWEAELVRDRDPGPVMRLPSQAQYREALADIGATWAERAPSPERPARPLPAPGLEAAPIGDELEADLELGAELAHPFADTAPADDAPESGATVSQAAPPPMIGPSEADELEALIDSYLGDRSNDDVWRFNMENERREWCFANSIPYEPMEW